MSLLGCEGTCSLVSAVLLLLLQSLLWCFYFSTCNFELNWELEVLLTQSDVLLLLLLLAHGKHDERSSQQYQVYCQYPRTPQYLGQYTRPALSKEKEPQRKKLSLRFPGLS